MAHGRSGVQQHEEDHGAPADHVEAVDGYDETERRQEELPERPQADHGRLGPGVFLGETVAVGIRACLVGPALYRHDLALGGVLP